MTEVIRPEDERPQLGNMFRVLPDRAKRTFYVRPDYFAELRAMAVSADQQPYIDELHFLRRLMRVPEGTECRIEVVYD